MKKDSLVWLEELVESAKLWRSTDGDAIDQSPMLCALATAVDGYTQAIEDEVTAELDAEEKET